MLDFYRVISGVGRHLRITSGEDVCMDLFTGDECALLFDTGYGFGDLRRFVEGRIHTPLIIVNSHGHVDHTCGNYMFSHVPVYMNAKEQSTYLLHNTKAFRKDAAVSLGKKLNRDLIIDTYAAKKVPATRMLFDGMTFHLGGVTITAVELPGHTEGGIGLLYNEERVLFTGDAISPVIWLFLEESASLGTLRKTILKAKKLPIDRYFISHRPAVFQKSDMDGILECIDAADYEKAPVIGDDIMLPTEKEVRALVRPGYRFKDKGKEGFSSILVTKDKLIDR